MGNIERGTPTNTYQRYKFFSTVAYNIGGQVFTLNDIEMEFSEETSQVWQHCI